MFGLGTTEMVIVLVLVLIIFGAGKLPLIGGQLGKGLRELKKGINEADDESSVEVDIKPIEEKLAG